MNILYVRDAQPGAEEKAITMSQYQPLLGKVAVGKFHILSPKIHA